MARTETTCRCIEVAVIGDCFAPTDRVSGKKKKSSSRFTCRLSTEKQKTRGIRSRCRYQLGAKRLRLSIQSVSDKTSLRPVSHTRVQSRGGNPSSLGSHVQPSSRGLYYESDLRCATVVEGCQKWLQTLLVGVTTKIAAEDSVAYLQARVNEVQ